MFVLPSFRRGPVSVFWLNTQGLSGPVKTPGGTPGGLTRLSSRYASSAGTGCVCEFVHPPTAPHWSTYAGSVSPNASTVAGSVPEP